MHALLLQEYLIGVRLIKAFGTYDKETEKFENANINLMEKGVASQIIVTLVVPLITLTVGIGTVIVIFTGSMMFTLNLANPGDITAFTIYMAQILTLLIMITNIFNTFVRTKASTARIQEILDCEGDFGNSGEKEGIDYSDEIKKLNGDIEFEKVTFAYPKNTKGTLMRIVKIYMRWGKNIVQAYC